MKTFYCEDLIEDLSQIKENVTLILPEIHKLIYVAKLFEQENLMPLIDTLSDNSLIRNFLTLMKERNNSKSNYIKNEKTFEEFCTTNELNNDSKKNTSKNINKSDSNKSGKSQSDSNNSDKNQVNFGRTKTKSNNSNLRRNMINCESDNVTDSSQKDKRESNKKNFKALEVDCFVKNIKKDRILNLLDLLQKERIYYPKDMREKLNASGFESFNLLIEVTTNLILKEKIAQLYKVIKNFEYLSQLEQCAEKSESLFIQKFGPLEKNNFYSQEMIEISTKLNLKARNIFIISGEFFEKMENSTDELTRTVFNDNIVFFIYCPNHENEDVMKNTIELDKFKEEFTEIMEKSIKNQRQAIEKSNQELRDQDKLEMEKSNQDLRDRDKLEMEKSNQDQRERDKQEMEKSNQDQRERDKQEMEKSNQDQRERDKQEMENSFQEKIEQLHKLIQDLQSKIV